MAPPTFSVVVPAYRTQDVVADVVESVLAQTRTDWELVVVDDCSPDELHRHVEPYLADPRVHLLRLPHNRGVSGARNEGIAATSGRLVSFVDSDDVLGPRFLELVSAQMAARPGAGVVGFLPTVTGAHGEPTTLPGVDVPPPSRADDPEAWLLHLLETPFHFRGTSIPREVLDVIGGFDESLWLGEDLELWVRVVLSGRPGSVSGEHAYVHRLAGESLTRQPGRTVERSQAHLRALDRIEEQMDRTDDRARALATARRIPRALEATGRFRAAVRDGDTAAARRHARTMATLDPSARSRLLWAVSHLPGPVVRAAYTTKRRRAGTPSG